MIGWIQFYNKKQTNNTWVYFIKVYENMSETTNIITKVLYFKASLCKILSHAIFLLS